VLIFQKESDMNKSKTSQISFSLSKEDAASIGAKRDVKMTYDQFSKSVLLPCIYKKR